MTLGLAVVLANNAVRGKS